MPPASHSSAQASHVITITGIGDHDRPDWLITMTGIRSQWVETHKDQVELFYLPAYAPEHNPDEYLNNDLKQHLKNMPRPDTREVSWSPKVGQVAKRVSHP